MTKILYQLLFILLGLLATISAQPQTNHDYLIYLSKTFDDHSTHLNGFYSQYWVKQAPLLRESAIKQLKSSYLRSLNTVSNTSFLQTRKISLSFAILLFILLMVML